MAKIDITKIEGYKEDMTAEEKLKLYESYDIAEPSYDGYIKKDTFDKTASELASVKKQLKDRMSEDEVKEAERAQKDAEIMEELKTLRAEKLVSEMKARYLGLGYDEKLASDTAKAYAEGNIDAVFKNQKIFQENSKKAIEAELLANTPRPPVGDGDGTPMTKEKFLGLSTAEQLKYKEENTNWQEILK